MAYKNPEDAKEYQRLYREQNKERRAKQKAEYYLKHREEILAKKKEYTKRTANKRAAYYAEYNKTKRLNAKTYHKNYYESNKEKILKQKQQYREDNPEIVKAAKQIHYQKYRQKLLNQKKQYRQANKGQIAYINAMRKKVVKQRTPKWTTLDDKWMLKQAYELAALRSELFGFKWHVDHIIPLQGKLISGLHVANNIQVIPAIDNIRKRNKFEINHGRS